MTCRTCKWLDVHPDKDGRVRIRKLYYECLAPVPECPPLPYCITLSHYGQWTNFRWPPYRSRVMPDRGAGCPLWQAREKTA